jgi:hypothetical protein
VTTFPLLSADVAELGFACTDWHIFSGDRRKKGGSRRPLTHMITAVDQLDNFSAVVASLVASLTGQAEDRLGVTVLGTILPTMACSLA